MSLEILNSFQEVRKATLALCKPLEIEDYVVQTAEFMSPPRWHLGHTTWFFEMLLAEIDTSYVPYQESYLYFFNSYYERFGERIPRGNRGTRSRPTVKETLAYRNAIDERMENALSKAGNAHQKDSCFLARVVMGLEHEMQHQELLVYDIKHLLCDLYDAGIQTFPKIPTSRNSGYIDIPGGLFLLGTDPSASFAWDNEKPAHRVYVEDFKIDRQLVTISDYLEFMNDEGYQKPLLWLQEGWKKVQHENWDSPLYWEQKENAWFVRDFRGHLALNEVLDEPVMHVSYFEANAYAKWKGKRLLTESEWERAATLTPSGEGKFLFPWGNTQPTSHHANLFEYGRWCLSPVGADPEGRNIVGVEQLIGNVWEWTSSDYAPYPGFHSEFDEYNDKFFINQKVLRGGSFATPAKHIRSTYRNFYYPHERWMACGFRCANIKAR
jgi:ergothioneine biosynthesis protein EgtB